VFGGPAQQLKDGLTRACPSPEMSAVSMSFHQRSRHLF
jgi:hypothetical protein